MIYFNVDVVSFQQTLLNPSTFCEHPVVKQFCDNNYRFGCWSFLSSIWKQNIKYKRININSALRHMTKESKSQNH